MRTLTLRFAQVAAASTLALLLASCETVTPFQPDVAVGGRLVSIARAPGRPSEFLVASETGGVFRSIDNGVTWRHVNGLPSHRTQDVAYAPDDPNIILVTFRDDFRAGPNSGPIWRSSDGGRSWSEAQIAIPTGTYCPSQPAAYGISFEPGSQRVYVGTSCGGVAASSDRGITWSVERPWPEPYWSVNVSSVLALQGGRVIALGPNLLALRDSASGLWIRAVGAGPGSLFKDCIHCLAASPVNSEHLFAIASDESLLQSNDGGLSWSAVAGTTVRRRNREPFISVSGELSERGAFDLFVGDGTWMQKLRFETAQNSATVVDRSRPNGEHVDVFQVMFDLDNRTPLFVVGDGGLMRAKDGGADWRLTAGGKAGLNALQMRDVNGQWVGDSKVSPQLYFATQDNYFWTSNDRGQTWPKFLCCEGGPFQLDRRVADPSDARLVVSGRIIPCSTCKLAFNAVSTNHFEDVSAWNNAPSLTGDSETFDTPIRLNAGRYLQSTHSTSFGFKNIYRLTENWSQDWKPGAVKLLNRHVFGPPAVIQRSADHLVIQPAQKSGIVWGPNVATYGLLRWTFPGDEQQLSGPTLKSLALDGSRAPASGIFAVNPQNPQQLLAVDAGDKDIKYSNDGGETWQQDATLTSLVTDGGRYRFMVDSSSLITTIGWDPDAPCHILVGAKQGGIYETQDGGNHWNRIRNSERIPEVTSFYFPPRGAVIVSSFGRGLWKLDVDRNPRHCAPNRGAFMIDVSARPFDPISEKASPASPGSPFPLECADCQIIVARDGEIEGVEMDGIRLTAFALRSGMVFAFDRRGNEIPLAIPNVDSSELHRDERVPKIFLERSIKALVVRGERLVAVVESGRELDFMPRREPQTAILGARLAFGVSVVSSGEDVTLVGRGFAARQSVAIDLWSDGAVRETKRTMTSDDGHFRIVVAADGPPGPRRLVATQQDGKRLIKTVSNFQVERVDEQGDTSIRFLSDPPLVSSAP